MVAHSVSNVTPTARLSPATSCMTDDMPAQTLTQTQTPPAETYGPSIRQVHAHSNRVGPVCGDAADYRTHVTTCTTQTDTRSGRQDSHTLHTEAGLQETCGVDKQ